MSNDNKSLRKNFLKTQIFNLDQTIKSKAAERTKDIDKSLQEIETIEKRLEELKDFTNKDDICITLNKYKFLLTLIRINEIDLFNYIDHYYKFGNLQVGVFIGDTNPTKLEVKKPRKKKQQ